MQIDLTEAGPVVVPEEDLQNKVARPYFVRGMETEATLYAIKSPDLVILTKFFIWLRLCRAGYHSLI